MADATETTMTTMEELLEQTGSGSELDLTGTAAYYLLNNKVVDNNALKFCSALHCHTTNTLKIGFSSDLSVCSFV